MNNKLISVHVSEQDKLQIQARAKAANMSVSEYILSILKGVTPTNNFNRAQIADCLCEFLKKNILRLIQHTLPFHVPLPAACGYVQVLHSQIEFH